MDSLLVNRNVYCDSRYRCGRERTFFAGTPLGTRHQSASAEDFPVELRSDFGYYNP